MIRWIPMLATRFRHYFYGQPETVPLSVRDAQHRLNNEVQQLNAQVQRIRKAADPIDELLRALQQAQQRTHN